MLSELLSILKKSASQNDYTLFLKKLKLLNSDSKDYIITNPFFGVYELSLEIFNLVETIPSKKMRISILNELLIYPGHVHHQYVARELQEIADNSTLPYIRQALESNFDYLEYTSSEIDVIAKWFSWILYEIGTNEALQMLEEYSRSSVMQISQEMKYRLGKINNT